MLGCVRRSINEPGRGRMLAFVHTPGRRYGGGGQKRVTGGEEAGEAGEAEAGAAKKAKQSNVARDHCPPYDPLCARVHNLDGDLMPVGAHVYYDFLGACQCVAQGRNKQGELVDQKCDHGKMVHNKFTPWTRFPVGQGRFFCEEFVTWKNPMACRSPADVKDVWQPSLEPAPGAAPGVQMVVTYDYSKMGKNKWMKFWYAVHELHEWV